MKKITFNKSLTFFIALFCVVNFGFGQTTLVAGDIAITGINSINPDGFSFVLLKDVVSGTQIKFTDKGWQSSGDFRIGGEGIMTWTATSDLSCGTQVIITDLNNPYVADIGTIIDSGTFGLNNSGDQLSAFQGPNTAPNFLYAINYGPNDWTNTLPLTTQTSAIPSGLTDGVTAVYIGNESNGSYNCAVTSNQVLILAAVSNASNWNLDSSAYDFSTVACTFTCVPCPTTTTWTAGAWDNGTPDINTNAIIADYYNTTANGSFTACSLTVNAGFKLDITNNHYVEVETDLVATGDITVQTQGSFIQNNDFGSVSGTGLIQVIKQTAPMKAWYEYTYWSSPVLGESFYALAETNPNRRFIFKGENYLDATFETNNDDSTGDGHDDIDDNGDDWQWVPGSTIMQPGIGYAATLTPFAYNVSPGGPTKQITMSPFEGLFHNGIYEVPIYRNDYELGDNNWNLIGNPYPSAIDADLFLAVNTEIDETATFPPRSIVGAIYLWSQNTAPSAIANGNQQLNFSDSDFAIINGIAETAGGDLGVGNTNPSNRKIPSGQAFFVCYSDTVTPISTSTNGDGHPISKGKITFNNSMRALETATDNSQFYKNSSQKKISNQDNKFWVNLTSDNGVFNQIAVAYVNNATDSDDGSFYDTQKPAGIVTGAILYSSIKDSDKRFGIQGKASNSLDIDETISLGFKSNIGVATLFKLSIDRLEGDFLTGNTIYLKDNLLNKVHNLSASDYTFTTEVGEFNSRFEIVFNANALSTEDVLSNKSNLSIVELNDNQVQFNVSDNLKIKSVAIFDLLGRQLYDFKGQNSTETYNLYNVSSMVYIAKVTLSNGAVITKKAVKK